MQQRAIDLKFKFKLTINNIIDLGNMSVKE